MRVIIAELKQESNTFAPMTTVEDFNGFHLLYGHDVIEKLQGTNSEIAGFLNVLKAKGHEAIPMMAAFAVSGGPLTAEAYKFLTERLYSGIRSAGKIDGVLLALHGAMVSVGESDADGAIIEKVREIVGSDVPIMVTMDLHANITKKKIKNSTTISGFRTCPHIDLIETGERAARMLCGILGGTSNPTMAWQKVPMVTPACKQIDFKPGSYRDLLQETISLDLRGAIDSSAFTVQPWLDIPELGYGAIVITENNLSLAKELTSQLAQKMWELRSDLIDISLLTPSQAIEIALKKSSGPVVMSDLADGTGAGSPGDSSAVLAALVAAKPNKRCLVSVCDPEVALLAASVGVGAEISTSIGAKKSFEFCTPTQITATVIRSGVEHFRFTQKGYNGMRVEMGLCAVLEIGEIRVLVTSLPAFTTDPEFYRCVGLEPSTAQIVVVKSHAQFQDSYDAIASEIIFLDTPGMSSDNVAELPFTKIDRPLYPWDLDLVFDARVAL
ncbi:MAG: M81 family metallopeptidase [Actinomycetes bacterium]